MNAIESYIRASAIARGIDPDIAVRVARAEGGLDNPVRQSDVVKNGRRETSYGPFQLLIGGGLGDAALAAGIDPRDPKQWKRGVDFALNEAANKGWGQWYGAKAVGLSNKAGLDKAHPLGVTLTATPYSGYVPGGVNAAPKSAPYGGYIPGGLGSSGAGAPVTSPSALATGAPAASGIAGLFGEGGPLSKLAGALGGGGQTTDPSLTQITPSSIGAEVGSGFSEQAAMLMAQLMADRRKKKGVSLDDIGALV